MIIGCLPTRRPAHGLLWLAIFLAGCAAVSEIADPYGGKYRYIWRLVEPAGTDGVQWEDDKISISFAISDKAIGFELQNRTDSAIKVMWDEVVIIKFGKAMRAVHSGVKYIERSHQQPPTVVPAKTRISDMVLPSDDVYWRDGYYGRYTSTPGGWEIYDLLPSRDLNKGSDEIMCFMGCKMGLYLPVLHGEVTTAYEFEFEVVDIVRIR